MNKGQEGISSKYSFCFATTNQSLAEIMRKSNILNNFLFFLRFFNGGKKIGIRRDKIYPFTYVFISSNDHINRNIDIHAFFVKDSIRFEQIAKGVGKLVFFQMGK